MKKIIFISIILAISFSLLVFSALASRGDLEYFEDTQRLNFNQNWQIMDQEGNAGYMGFRVGKTLGSAGQLIIGSKSNIFLLNNNSSSNKFIGLNCDIFQGVLNCKSRIIKTGLETSFQLQLGGKTTEVLKSEELDITALNGNIYFHSDKDIIVNGLIINDTDNDTNDTNVTKAYNLLLYRAENNKDENDEPDISFTNKDVPSFEGNVEIITETPINGSLRLLIPSE